MDWMDWMDWMDSCLNGILFEWMDWMDCEQCVVTMTKMSG